MSGLGSALDMGNGKNEEAEGAGLNGRLFKQEFLWDGR